MIKLTTGGAVVKIDHLVVNVDKYVQEEQSFIEKIQAMGLPYVPKWGKGTKGFKVSNIWIGKEYFEFVTIKTADGGGWVKDWVSQFHAGHRGLIGFALEVDDITATYKQLRNEGILVTAPEPLKFKWFFNLLTRTMPWRNSYLPAFKGVPFQFFLQQLNDEKTKKYMEQYMVPNSLENDIVGISEVTIYGNLTKEDKKIMYALFDRYEEQEKLLTIYLENQTIHFREANTYKVEVVLTCNNKEFENKSIQINNLEIKNKC